jgi:hypothetical protein
MCNYGSKLSQLLKLGQNLGPRLVRVFLGIRCYGLGVAVLVSVREGLVKGGRMWPSRGRAYVVRLGLLIRITGLPSVMGSTCITASHRSKQVSLLYLLYVKCSERVCFR